MGDIFKQCSFHFVPFQIPHVISTKGSNRRPRYALKKKNDIICEFFPNVRPPPPPPPFGNPLSKKKF